jgi:phage shock protein C
MTEKEIKRLYRSRENRVIAGVCGGLGEYFNVDPVLVRLLWIGFSLMWGIGVLIYLVAWIIIPENPKQVKKIKGSDKK